MKFYVTFVSAQAAYLCSVLMSLDHFYQLIVGVEVIVDLDHNDIYRSHSVRLLLRRDRP
jgi:hypothetical protein